MQSDPRKPTVIGAMQDYKCNHRGRRNPMKKHDIDKSTNRLVNNFLARKPLLAQRMHAQSSCTNSPAGTEFISSGGS